MRGPVVTIGPDASLSEAARLMADRRINRLPVLGEDGRLVGIASRADVVRTFLRPGQDITAGIRAEILDRIAPLADAPVAVTTREGVVTLEGTVGTRREAELVAELIGRVHGVVRVENRLHWEVDDAKADHPTSWALYHPHDPAPGQERQGSRA